MFDKLKRWFIMWLVGKFTQYQDLKTSDQGWSWIILKRITNHSKTKAVHEFDPFTAAKLQDTLAKWREGHPYSIEDEERSPKDAVALPIVPGTVIAPLDKKPLE